MRLKPFVRVCLSCGKKTDKNSLVKFCKYDGEIMLFKGDMHGKGIYLCHDCIKAIDSQKMLCKAFKTHVSEENSEKLLSILKEL